MPDREIARIRDGFIVRPPIEHHLRSPRSHRDEFVLAAAVALEVPAAIALHAMLNHRGVIAPARADPPQ